MVDVLKNDWKYQDTVLPQNMNDIATATNENTIHKETNISNNPHGLTFDFDQEQFVIQKPDGTSVIFKGGSEYDFSDLESQTQQILNIIG